MPLAMIGTIELQTDRLLLRRFAPGDAGSMLRNWISDPEVQRNYGEPVHESHEAVDELLAQWIARYAGGDFYRWAIILKEDGECIGQIAFCRVYPELAAAEAEYCVGQAHRGRGYAPEALREVLRYALTEAGFEKIEAFHREANPASGRVLAKAGMQRVDTVRRFEIEGKAPEHEVCYAKRRCWTL